MAFFFTQRLSNSLHDHEKDPIHDGVRQEQIIEWIACSEFHRTIYLTLRRLLIQAGKAYVTGGIFAFWLLMLQPYPLLRTSASLFFSSGSPYAYVTLLSQDCSLHSASLPDVKDTCYVATRTLLYQLLHVRSTATISSIFCHPCDTRHRPIQDPRPSP